MNDGTGNDDRYMLQTRQYFSAGGEALQFSPAGLSLSVSAHCGRSCSTRRTTMNLARSIALHATQKPKIPATHENSGRIAPKRNTGRGSDSAPGTKCSEA